MAHTNQFRENHEQTTIEVRPPKTSFISCCYRRNRLGKHLIKPDAVHSLINLSASDAPIDDRLNMLQDAILFMSKAKSDSTTLKELNAAVIALLCKRNPITRLLGSPNITPPGCHPYTLIVNELPAKVNRWLVDTSRVFDVLLMARHERPHHKGGASGLVYALASILSLSLFRTREGNSGYNETSPYLDLSALYGANEEEWETVRVNDGSGMLRPDVFYERRSHLTPTTRALLVIWSRNHNYIAHRLLAVNEGGRWSSALGPRSHQYADHQSAICRQDDEIFEISRLINCTQFKNVIIRDFAKGLFGLPNVGDSLELDIVPMEAVEDLQRGIPHEEQARRSCAEFSLLYNWSGLMSHEDEGWVKLQSSHHSALPLELTDSFDNPARPSQFRRLYTVSSEPQQLKRCPTTGYFDDRDLAAVLQTATESGACVPGARSSPECMKASEARLMDQGRAWGVCSLNQFRISLGLKPFRHFNEWNHDPTIVAAATELYGDIEHLELYPGLHAEEAMPGSGFGLGYTLTFALLIDMVSLVRGDPNFKGGPTRAEKLTRWGDSDCKLYRNEGAFHGQLPKVLMRNLAHHYPYNNIYGLFPLTTPSATQVMLERRHPPPKGKEPQNSQDPFEPAEVTPYDYAKPPNTRVITLDRKKDIRRVFVKNTDKLATTCGDDWKLLTEGYGYILGFDDEKLHRSDQNMILHALLPDIQHIISATLIPFVVGACRFFQECHSKSSDGSIDLIKDVINPTYTHWVYSSMLGFDHDSSPLSRESQALLYANCAAIYLFVFRKFEPQDGWTSRDNAIHASQELRDMIERQIDKFQRQQIAPGFQSQWRILPGIESVALFFIELFGRSKIGKPSDHPFLQRILRTINTIGRLRKYPGRFEKMKSSKKEREKFEHTRAVAHILGMVVISIISGTGACTKAAIQIRRHDSESPEVGGQPDSKTETLPSWTQWSHPCNSSSSGPNLFPVFRKVMKDITAPGITVKQGDRIFADFPQTPDEALTIDQDGDQPSRKPPVEYGYGLHRCPVYGLNRGKFMVFLVMNTKLISHFIELYELYAQDQFTTKPLKIFQPWGQQLCRSDPVYFMNREGDISPFPESLIVKPKNDQWDPTIIDKLVNHIRPHEPEAEDPRGPRVRRLERMILYGMLSLIFFMPLLLLLYPRVMPFLPTWAVSQAGINYIRSGDHIICREPVSTLRKWEANTIVPGPDGQPSAIEYMLNHPKPHRLSVVDIDLRDMQLSISVDGSLKGITTDFELDKSIDCGDSVETCLKSNFSGGVTVVPPGRHSVVISWFGKEFIPGTRDMDWGDDFSRRFKWQLESCA